jgi:hypothetical protein
MSLLQVKQNISKIRLNVTDDLWTLFQNSHVLKEDAWTGKVRDKLKAFEQDLLRSMKSDGWDGTEDESVVQWSFAGALFYSIIVITTIGKQRIIPSFIDYSRATVSTDSVSAVYRGRKKIEN